MMVFETVKEAVTRVLQVYPKEIMPESKLATDFGADSIDVVQILKLLESSLSIKFSEKDLESIITIDDLTKKCEELINKEN